MYVILYKKGGKNMKENNVNIPEEYKPISMWGYLGYQLLFSIPLIGFILLVVFSLGGTKNINLRNFARSYFCYAIIVLVIVISLFLIFAGTAFFQGFMYR